MVEIHWWQAALLSVAGAAAGGLISLVTAYFTQRWAASNSLKAEERQAKRRVEEERRQEIRQTRRDRIQPVLEFLTLAKQHIAHESYEGIIRRVHEKVKDKITFDQWREAVKQTYPAGGIEVDDMQLTKTALIAVSTFSAPNIQDAVADVFGAAMSAETSEGEVSASIVSAEELIEQYLAGPRATDEVPTGGRPAAQADNTGEGSNH